MTRSGDVDDPTKEYPNYAAADAGDPAAEEVGKPAATGRGAWARALIVAGVVLALLLSLMVGVRFANELPSFLNPFGQERVDRSQPVLLQSMRDMSRYVAAEGNFQVVIDLQNKRENIPEFLLNQRTLFVAAGRVEAYVDFTAIADGAVTVAEGNTAVEVRLPAPQLGQAALDLEKSYVFAEERGVLNRIADLIDGDPNRQREVYQLGEQRIAVAARDSGLAQRAQDNTRKMLEGLLRSLGYTKITVTFPAP